MRILVFVLFFLSGACGLVYQVVWSRILTEVFGATVVAVGTVLAAFMTGLALGSWALGKLGDRSDRPLRIYASLEIGIGLTALASTLLMGRAGTLNVWMHEALAGSPLLLGGVRLVAAFVLVMAPTVLMGATLPVLSRYFIGRLAEVGSSLSSLYAVNTAGAVAGALAAGFLMIGAYGVHRSIYLAVVANLGIGLVAWVVSKRPIGAAPRAVEGPTAGLEDRALPAGGRDPAESRLLLWAFAFSGFASFGYEVLWTRSLVHLLGNSTYAFTMMLTAFLSGIALGGYLVRFLVDRMSDRMRWFAWVQMLIGGSSAIALPALFGIVHSQALQAFVGRTSDELGILMLSRFLVSLLVMLVPATLIGATFPLAGRIYLLDLRRTSSDVGKVYAVNALGNVLGALAPGAVLLPLFGVQRGILLLAALNASIGLFILARRSDRLPALRHALPVGFVLAAALLARFPLGLQFPSQFQTPADRVLFYREGLSGTTKVLLDPGTGEKRMSIDGIVIGGTGRTDYKQQILAHLPKLLLADYSSELTIGVGSAVLAGESGRHRSLERIVGVEIEPSVIEGAAYFTEENHDVLNDPRTSIVVDDAANYLRAHAERFDIISADEKTADNYASNGFSYSREYYGLLREHLTPRGLVIQWIPSELPPDQYRMVLRTFATAFPHVSLWYFPPVGKVAVTSTFVVGSLREIEIDPARMTAALESEQRAFEGWRKYGITTAEAVVAHYVGDRDGVLRATEGARENSLENPYYEFYSPREYAVPINRRALQNHDSLVALRRVGGSTSLERLLVGGRTARLDDARQAEGEFLAGLRLFLEARPHSEVAARFDNALQRAPWNDSLRCQVQSYYWNLAGIHYLQGAYTDALRLLRRAVELYPSNGEVRYYHGLALLRTGSAAAAALEMQAAIALNPRLAAARDALVEIRQRSLR